MRFNELVWFKNKTIFNELSFTIVTLTSPMPPSRIGRAQIVLSSIHNDGRYDTYIPQLYEQQEEFLTFCQVRKALYLNNAG